MWRVMPWDLSAFVGRERERAALSGALAADDEAPQLHTLHGLAGAGKTRLARVVAGQVARAFPGGRIFCELDQGLESLAVALDAPAGDDIGERIAGALTLRERTLCLLDHAGAVHPALAAALPAWLSAGAHAFVVTSRAPLELRGARRLEIGPLDEAGAVELLARRLEELGRPPLDAGAARRLVDEVGRLPLGIELCAGGLGERSAESLLEPLGGLQSAQSDVPERHRSLERVAADTWGLLDLDGRHALAVASVFDGEFSLDDHAALGGEGLERLVALGLVARSGDVYRVSRWLRDFARARTPHNFVLKRAHVRRLLARAGSSPHELMAAGDGIASWDPELAARALLAAAEAMARGDASPARRAVLDRAVLLGDAEVAAAARIARAELARRGGRLGDAESDLAAIGEPPPSLAARAARIGALLALDGGEVERAERLFDQAVAVADSDRERARSLAMRFAHRLVLAEPADDADGALAYDLHRAGGDAQEAAAVLSNLGLAALHRGEDERGRDRLRRAEEEARASGERVGLAGARLFAGLADLATGATRDAIAALADAETMALELARWNLWSDAAGYGAVARLVAGEPAARAELASHTDELARRGPPHARALFAAVLHLVDDARPAPDRALARGRPLVASAIEVLAGATHSYGLPVRIAERVRQALAPPRSSAAPARASLAVSRDRRRFSIEGVAVDLTRRGPLGRVFAELVARAESRLPAATPEELIAAGWPGEAILPEAARLRLYNAVAALRAMGLRGALVTTEAGYRLDAAIGDLGG